MQRYYFFSYKWQIYSFFCICIRNRLTKEINPINPFRLVDSFNLLVTFRLLNQTWKEIYA